METIRSEEILQDFLNQKVKYKRKRSENSGTIKATPEEIFPLLCPTREADWIPGWNVELVYTESGYAEDKCIFRTMDSDIAGEGIWTFTGYEENEFIEFVKLSIDLIIHVQISLKQENENTTKITWNAVSTALTEKGNILIDVNRGHHGSSLIKLIDKYLRRRRT